MKKRLLLAHLVGYDQNHRSSAMVRELEMQVDSITCHLHHQPYSLQFFNDCRLYGIDEAYLYLWRFAHKNEGETLAPILMQDFQKLKDMIERIKGKFDVSRI
jgi:hypothetical protein